MGAVPVMNWRTTITRAGAVGATGGLAYAQWRITTPGTITFTEWRVALLVAGIGLIVVLTAAWVDNGRPSVDTDRDTYTQRDNPQVIRPPWS